jgi:hypothetical protein
MAGFAAVDLGLRFRKGIVGLTADSSTQVVEGALGGEIMLVVDLPFTLGEEAWAATVTFLF